jgi:hypothetical protein
MTEWYLVWSVEHSAWWRPGRCGYTSSLRDAGRYSHTEALAICVGAIPGTASRLGALPELPVAEADAMTLHAAFRGRYPGVPREAWEP